MATLSIDAESITVHLSTGEKLAALHGNVTVPRSTVVRARVVPDGRKEVHGIRAPGTDFPGLIKVGTWRHRSGRTFAVCRRRRPAVVLDLDGTTYARLVITVDDPATTVAALT